MDLAVSKEKQQELYNNHPIFYTVSDMTLSTIDPSMFFGGAELKSIIGTKTAINYSYDIARVTVTYDDDVIKGAGKVPNKITDLAKDMKSWLGNDARVIKNKNGDKVFMSGDET